MNVASGLDVAHDVCERINVGGADSVAGAVSAGLVVLWIENDAAFVDIGDTVADDVDLGLSVAELSKDAKGDGEVVAEKDKQLLEESLIREVADDTRLPDSEKEARLDIDAESDFDPMDETEGVSVAALLCEGLVETVTLPLCAPLSFDESVIDAVVVTESDEDIEGDAEVDLDTRGEDETDGVNVGYCTDNVGDIVALDDTDTLFETLELLEALIDTCEDLETMGERDWVAETETDLETRGDALRHDDSEGERDEATDALRVSTSPVDTVGDRV